MDHMYPLGFSYLTPPIKRTVYKSSLAASEDQKLKRVLSWAPWICKDTAGPAQEGGAELVMSGGRTGEVVIVCVCVCWGGYCRSGPSESERVRKRKKKKNVNGSVCVSRGEAWSSTEGMRKKRETWRGKNETAGHVLHYCTLQSERYMTCKRKKLVSTFFFFPCAAAVATTACLI